MRCVQVSSRIRCSGNGCASPCAPATPGVCWRPRTLEALLADLGDCLVWTAEGSQRVEGTLAHWEERLAGHGFLRVHRNALVRLGAIREVTDGDELVLPSGRLQVSKRRIEEVRRAMGL